MASGQDQVERQARQATVKIVTTPELSADGAMRGTGNLVRATGPDGRSVDYVLTNAHVVSMPDGVGRTLTGALIDHEYHYPVIDAAGKASVARLVAYNTGGVCSGRAQMLPDTEYRDMALLEIIDRSADVARHDRLLAAVGAERHAAPEAVQDGISVQPLAFDRLMLPSVAREGAYVACGYPAASAENTKSGLECSRGSFGVTGRKEGSNDPDAQLVYLRYAAKGSRVRPGYSGGAGYAEASGLPVALYTAGTDDRATGVPIDAVLRRLRDVKAQHDEGNYIAVGQAESGRCVATDFTWHGKATTVEPQPGESTGERLKRAAQAFRDGEAAPLRLEVSAETAPTGRELLATRAGPASTSREAAR